jgi:hypothetical protein
MSAGRWQGKAVALVAGLVSILIPVGASSAGVAYVLMGPLGHFRVRWSGNSGLVVLIMLSLLPVVLVWVGVCRRGWTSYAALFLGGVIWGLNGLLTIGALGGI